jgi:phenylacetate-CoA ligase
VLATQKTHSLPSAVIRPGLLSKMSSEVIRRTLYPAMQRRWHPSATRYLQELKKYEFASLESVQAIQWGRLRQLLEHAATHVPYYRDLFRKHGIEPKDIGSPQDFARIPVLTKSALQEQKLNLIAENHLKAEGLANASGGSTGKPVQFFQNAEYWDRAYASLWFVESWWGIRPGDSTASLWGADRDIPDQSWKERLTGAISQLRVCNAFALTPAQMDRFAIMLAGWQPRYVIGYASALEVFARFLLDRPELRIRPHAVRTTADVLQDEQRRLLEKVFACPVYNFYGSREVNNLAAECPAHEGLHVNSLTRYIEVVDDGGTPLPPGKPGRILLTDLTNYFMPFLRYEIEDIGSWKESRCPCGRPFPLLEQIWGRFSDFIVTPEGKLIHSVFFTHLFYDIPEVALFQINQVDLRDIRVYLTLRPGITEYPKELVRKRLAQAFGPGAPFCIRVVPKIDRPPSGKHRFTVSSVRPSWGENSQSHSKLRGAAAR